jgi:hypothetical protein
MSKKMEADELIADLERRRNEAVRTLEAEIARDQAALDKKREALRRLGHHQAKPRRDDMGLGRRNWVAILSGLPYEFEAGDVRLVRGMRQVRPSEIFAGITRWIETRRIIRVKRGLYRKINEKLPPPPAEPTVTVRKAKKPITPDAPSRPARAGGIKYHGTVYADVVLQRGIVKPNSAPRADYWIVPKCPLCSGRHMHGIDPDREPADSLGERGARCSQTKSYILRWDGHSEIGSAAEPAQADPKLQRAV